MAGEPKLNIGENSPEEVAYKLMKYIAVAEDKSLHNGDGVSREWLLRTYGECISTVRNGFYQPS